MTDGSPYACLRTLSASFYTPSLMTPSFMPDARRAALNSVIGVCKWNLGLGSLFPLESVEALDGRLDEVELFISI